MFEKLSDMPVLSCHYVLKMKKDIGHKVRIVDKFFRQVHGVDYNETNVPIVSPETVRIFFDIVAHPDLEYDQTDVITAFLSGNLDEEIFIEVLDSLKDPRRSILACNLLKFLYVLYQAQRQCFAKINSFLVEDLQLACCP